MFGKKTTFRKKAIIKIVAVTLAVLVGLCVADNIADLNRRVAPVGPKSDIGALLAKTDLSASDYETLFRQTGLGRPAVDDLREKPDSADAIIAFQDAFFSDPIIECERTGLATKYDWITDSEGNIICGHGLAPIKTGDVLITFSTHTLGWRHGHAGLVLDAEKGDTLEAVTWGHPTEIRSADQWLTYPTLAVLRLRGATSGELESVVKSGRESLVGLPYVLTTGFFSAKNAGVGELSGTQCAHAVWYPFILNGYDIDSNGSPLVTPDDILNSDLFDVVQIFGMDPEKFIRKEAAS
jgi:uncharacterized protein YycO